MMPTSKEETGWPSISNTINNCSSIRLKIFPLEVSEQMKAAAKTLPLEKQI